MLRQHLLGYNELWRHSKSKRARALALSPSLDGYTIEIWENLPYGKTVFHHAGQTIIQMKGEAVQMVFSSIGMNTHVDWVCLCACVGVFVYKDLLSCDRLQHTNSSGEVEVRALCFRLSDICETSLCSHVFSSNGECEHIRGSMGLLPLFLYRTLIAINSSTVAPLSVTVLLFT